ncbi:MAP kinase-activated protein kinase 2 (Fragment) [Seminavis robusta]|uniref:MAP kinase-activated protein kinase 2 n=1 Tax=Seminavis robusta TaxID=568900 RepID=A0A9N8DMT3_9STRA
MGSLNATAPLDAAVALPGSTSLRGNPTVGPATRPDASGTKTVLGFSPDMSKNFGGCFDIKERLGVGTTGAVCHIVEKKTGKSFAVKVIKRSSLPKIHHKRILLEASIMKKVSYLDHVVTLHGLLADQNSFYLVQDLGRGGDLCSHLMRHRRAYSEERAKAIAIKLFTTMRELHQRNIIHRDIKLDNIVLSDPQDDTSVLLADFGLAAILPRRGYATRKCGSPLYCAPEVMGSRPYGNAVDMWSIGIVLFMLLSLRRPFVASSVSELYQKISDGAQVKFEGSPWDTVSKEAKECIRGLLTADPHERWTAEQALRSPWIVGAARVESQAR